MIFEFLAIHECQQEDEIGLILIERLREVLEANLNDVDEETLARTLRVNFDSPSQNLSEVLRRRLVSFSLDLIEETVGLRDVVDEFCEALTVSPIVHVVKCEDPLLRAELAARSEELFAIEMKLRRVLSIIYHYAYPSGDPYDLLREEAVQPMGNPKPTKDQMKAVAENQFFHLTLGQYVGLNQRHSIKDLSSLIRNETTYEAFRSELLRRPVEHEEDASFLAGLKERMDSIEKMRNAVAHNRRPSKKMTNDYLNALPLVGQALDNYVMALVADWRDPGEVE